MRRRAADGFSASLAPLFFYRRAGLLTEAALGNVLARGAAQLGASVWRRPDSSAHPCSTSGSLPRGQGRRTRTVSPQRSAATTAYAPEASMPSQRTGANAVGTLERHLKSAFSALSPPLCGEQPDLCHSWTGDFPTETLRTGEAHVCTAIRSGAKEEARRGLSPLHALNGIEIPNKRIGIKEKRLKTDPIYLIM